MLPLFRRLEIRYIQCARSERTTTTSGDGVVILDDSTYPQRLHIDGAYRLSTEMITAGTVPQLGGARKCGSREGVGARSGDQHGHRRAALPARDRF